ncbi:MAG: hypothetical protein M1840_002588 [Geoglossum simile]|nr:MAG: hypothetical protein M1840_002588 [Geoglossum simile]
MTTINVIFSNLVQTSTPTVRLSITAVILPSAIQMPCIEPHPKTPIRQSTRTPRPSAHKRANSESTSQPPPSSQHAKKACTATAPPVNPRRRQIIPDDIDEEQFNGGDDDVDATQLKEQAEQIEEEYEEEDEEEEGEEKEEEEKEEDALRYTSVWKAMVNTKETLCSKSGIYTESDLSIYSIRVWQREVLEHARPRQLEIVKFEAITSYERCRALDECPFELQYQDDFQDALEMLKIWYMQHKRVSLRIMLFLKEAIPEPRTQADPNSSSKPIGGHRTTTQW